MGACSGAGGAIIFHRFFQECALLVCQRMHISHHRNLILGCPIKNEGMNSVGYGQILYQKTFSRALNTRLRCLWWPSAVEPFQRMCEMASSPRVCLHGVCSTSWLVSAPLSYCVEEPFG